MKINIKKLTLAVALLVLPACSSTGDHYQGDVFSSTNVHQQHTYEQAIIVETRSVKVKVDNRDNKNSARMIGGIGGAVLGGMIKNTKGALIGAGTGYVIGESVPKEKLVNGVLLYYTINGKKYSNVQTGDISCYTIGNTTVVKLKNNTVQVQPNNC